MSSHIKSEEVEQWWPWEQVFILTFQSEDSHLLRENKIFISQASQNWEGSKIKSKGNTVTGVKEGYESLQSLIIFSSFQYFYREQQHWWRFENLFICTNCLTTFSSFLVFSCDDSRLFIIHLKGLANPTIKYLISTTE